MSDKDGKPVDDKGQKPADDSSKQQPTADQKIAELEKKLGEMGTAMGELKEFADGAAFVVNTVAFTPELRESFQKIVKGQLGTDKQISGQQQEQNKDKADADKGNDSQVKEIDTRVKGVEESQREQIILDFEDRFGVAKLPDEQKKETRKKVETYLNEFGLSVKNAPIQSLAHHLEKAYVGTHAEKLREEGKLEGITQYHANEMGSMPSMGGNYQVQSDTKELTAKQKEWAKKLKVDESKAAEKYFSQDEEKDRVTPAEQKKQ